MKTNYIHVSESTVEYHHSAPSFRRLNDLVLMGAPPPPPSRNNSCIYLNCALVVSPLIAVMAARSYTMDYKLKVLDSYHTNAENKHATTHHFQRPTTIACFMMATVLASCSLSSSVYVVATNDTVWAVRTITSRPAACSYHCKFRMWIKWVWSGRER